MSVKEAEEHSFNHLDTRIILKNVQCLKVLQKHTQTCNPREKHFVLTEQLSATCYNLSNLDLCTYGF